MKKLVSLVAAICLFSASLFADGFFSKRIVDFYVDVPASFSNNYFGVSDIMKKDLVIDLTKIAKEMPNNGLSFVAKTSPSLGMNLNLLKFTLGFSTGVDVYTNFGLEKGIFDLLGTGVAIDKPLKFGMNMEADAFLYTNAHAGFSFKFLSLDVCPSLFLPIVHVFAEDASVSVKNTEDGKISMDAVAKLNAYAAADVMNFDITKLSDDITKSLGFDVAGSVHIKTLIDHFDFWATARIPVVPGHLKYGTTVSASASAYADVPALVESLTKPKDSTSDADSGSGEPTADEGDAGGTPPEVTPPPYGFDKDLPDISTIGLNQLEKAYYINRPLKFDVYTTFAPLKNFLSVTGGVGFGIRNPYSSVLAEVKFYPEYYFGGQVGLGNIVVVKASTEYTDQIFIHQVALKLNVRVLELNAGVSLQSGNFASSFKVAGAGVFINAHMGF